MAEDKKNHDTPDLDQRDLKNPRDRDALKRAADDFLKSRKAEEYALAQDDEMEANANNWAELDKLRAENDELKDRPLRVAADMENLRRRTARDVHDARAYAIANFARDMLSVSDNLRRALEAVPDECGKCRRCRLQGAVRRRRHHRAGDDVGPGTSRRQEARSLKAKSSIRTSIRRCSKCPMPTFRHNTVVQVVQSRLLDRRPHAAAGHGRRRQRAGRNRHAAEGQPEPGPINQQAENDA